ncbi:MAG: type II toxin-antitoxin system VapC family toxin [Actinomycetia bacterium]|nr:type II toxin-antitoxin system VapC family toxin [Actinomycetes bacterium]
MIIDSSVLVAILLREPDRPDWLRRIRLAGPRSISAATYTEIGIVIDARGEPTVRRQFDVLLAELKITVRDLTARQAEIARAAYRDFGKGSGHPARLNLGDTFSYALAMDRDESLLFKGDDFTHTDVRRAR